MREGQRLLSGPLVPPSCGSLPHMPTLKRQRSHLSPDCLPFDKGHSQDRSRVRHRYERGAADQSRDGPGPHLRCVRRYFDIVTERAWPQALKGNKMASQRGFEPPASGQVPFVAVGRRGERSQAEGVNRLHRIRCWRERDSNPRSPVRMTELFRDCQILDLDLRNISLAALHARAVPA